MAAWLHLGAGFSFLSSGSHGIALKRVALDNETVNNDEPRCFPTWKNCCKKATYHAHRYLEDANQLQNLHARKIKKPAQNQLQNGFGGFGEPPETKNDLIDRTLLR